MQEISVESDSAKLAGVKFCNRGAGGKKFVFFVGVAFGFAKHLILLFLPIPLEKGADRGPWICVLLSASPSSLSPSSLHNTALAGRFAGLID
jgi:hypothetical protein